MLRRKKTESTKPQPNIKTDAEQSELRIWRHEYNNNLIALRALIEHGENEKALSYIDAMSLAGALNGDALKTGNPILDAIVSAKIQSARSHGIDVGVQAIYPESSPVADNDLCAIAGNLLDNAIEACLRMSGDSRRFITFSLLLKGSNMIISVTNSCDEDIQKDGERYITSKEDDGHGLGIGHIDSIIDKYRGHVLREHGDGIFETHVVIPLRRSGDKFKENIFIKSMLRQRIRSVILVLLIAAAVFLFVVRVVEYIVVTEQIDAVGSYYRSIGFLQVAESTDALGNVIAGAEIVRGSAYTAFEDRRRDAAGYLQGSLNSDIRGMRDYIQAQLGMKDAFFCGELISMEFVPFYEPPSHIMHIKLIIRVDSVLAGYPEHVALGQEVILRYILEGDERDVYYTLDAYDKEFLQQMIMHTPLSDMQVGQRYLLRGALYELGYQFLFFQHPEEGRNTEADKLNLRPLNEDTSDNTRELQGDALWYIHIPPGQTEDLSSKELSIVNAEIERMRRSQSVLTLRTTTDMTAMPILQPPRDLIQMVDGRWLNLDDHLNSNHVAMIHEEYAEYRGLKIGDTITVNVPHRQVVTDWKHPQGLSKLIVEGAEEEGVVYTLELEIVGLLSFPDYIVTSGQQTPGPPVELTLETDMTCIVFIPDSILPDLEFERSNPVFENLGWTDGAEYLPEFLYSFALDDSRNEAAFMLEYRDAIAEQGVTVVFLQTGAGSFWAAAEPIMRSSAFNAIVFCAACLLVLSLVVFLYLQQRRRDFAILRALGMPVKKVFVQILTSVIILGLPAVIIGGVVAWFFALNQVASTLNPFGEIVTALNFSLDLSLSILWLPVFVSAGICALAAITAVGATFISRRPVLELLQGAAVKDSKKSRTSGANTAGDFQSHATAQRTTSAIEYQNRAGAPPTGVFAPAVNGKLTKNKKMELYAAIRFILRHVARASVKSILAAAVTVFFIMSLGYLRVSIDRTAREIDTLYNTIVVEASILPEYISSPVRGFGGMIRPKVVSDIMGSGFAQNVYTEGLYAYGVVVPAEDDGSPPEDWKASVGWETGSTILTGNSRLSNPYVAFGDAEQFIMEHSNVDAAAGERTEEMRIEFMEGFDESDFVYASEAPIPILLTEHVMDMRGLRLGDTVYLYSTHIEFAIGVGARETGLWRRVSAVVVGTHNGELNTQVRFRYDTAVLMPLSAMDHATGREAGYTKIDFTIDPARNREIAAIRDELHEFVGGAIKGWGTQLNLFLYDEELRTAVGSLDQNLSLLQLLYPVAIALSVVIGFGMTMLLMLQNAKAAAIMRVLGAHKKRSRLILCAEQFAVCLSGVIIGLCVLASVGWGSIPSVLLALLYLIGAMAGSLAGGILVTNKQPLELLQVKE